jgi:hypothetical protein
MLSPGVVLKGRWETQRPPRSTGNVPHHVVHDLFWQIDDPLAASVIDARAAEMRLARREGGNSAGIRMPQLGPAPDIMHARFDEAYQVFITGVAREILLSVRSQKIVEAAHDLDAPQGSLVTWWSSARNFVLIQRAYAIMRRAGQIAHAPTRQRSYTRPPVCPEADIANVAVGPNGRVRGLLSERPFLAHSFRTGTGRYDPFGKSSATGICAKEAAGVDGYC